VIVSFGGGSTIDCTKAAEVLRTLGGSIEDYFGVGLVTAKLQSTGRKLTPHVAIQSAASSGAHLTKYSNITDLKGGQKKLIVDNAIVPERAIFDYAVTAGAPASLTADGALDGISHSLEVLYGAVGKPYYEEMLAVARAGIGLALKYLPAALSSPRDMEARQGLGLATDLGGYAIMLGGTNGAHLTSFSLIDILSHGRACAIMNPYYTVFFAPAIQGPLKLVAELCLENGYAGASILTLEGRELGIAVARALMSFERKAGVPPVLGEAPGFTDAHIQRALAAAKNPQLKMKLENMPVPMTAEMVDEYMGPILQAAKTGELDLVRNVAA
jgi:alcohol dehydrogenase class IV